MKKILYFLRDKWVKKTSLTIIISAVLIALFLVINTIAVKLNVTPWDFTKEKRYTLSDESKEIARSIKQNVTMYFFGYEEDSDYVRLAKQYEKENDKIQLKVVSFIDNPSLATSLGIGASDTIIAFQSSQRNKLISESDLVTYDLSTYQQIDVSEQKFTNALLDVTVTKKPQVYFLEGNGEFTTNKDGFMNTISLVITNEVNDVKTIDLLTADMPEECDVLFIANPTQDFTESETNKILDYIHKGGNIIWLQNPYAFIGADITADSFPNIQRVLNEYGIRFSNGVVCETGSSNMLVGRSDYVIPVLNYNDIVKDLYTDGKIALIDPGKIDFVSNEELSNLQVSKDNFITTTEGAYYNVDVNKALTQDEEDEEGEFVLGTALTKKIDDNTSSKMIAISNAYFASDASINVSNNNKDKAAVTLRNNKDIILNSVDYLSEKDDSVRIRKNTDLVTFLQATDKEDKVVKLIIFGLPVLVVIVGVVVITKRNNEKGYTKK